MLIQRTFKLLQNLPKMTVYRCFSKEKEEDYGVQFDEEQIRRKMQEIRQRREKPKMKKQQKFEFMSANPNTQLTRKIRKFRQQTNTEHLLQFGDPSIQEKPTILQITGFDDNIIQVDNMVYPPAMIIFPKQLLVWEVPSVEELTIDDFIILKYISPRPTYVIVGVNDPQKFPESIRKQLSSLLQNFDVLPMFEALSQFNTTANDDINVVAFLLAK